MTEEQNLFRSGRQRDQRLAPYVRNTKIWHTLFGMMEPRHAADEIDPRLLPSINLHEAKQRIASGAPPGTGPVPDALRFAFCVDRYPMPAEQAILLPAEHLWWLVSETDTVLLSDRVTHHYTGIARTDREQERILFDDLWPDDFFLLPGHNTLGIEAKGLSISRAEFVRAVRGLVTWDTPQLLDNYFMCFPEQAKNADVLLRCGYALLDPGADLFAARAATLCAHAAQIAQKSGKQELALVSARQAFLAAACAMYSENIAGQRASMESMKQLLTELIGQYGRETLESGLLPHELARFGNAAYAGGDFDTALSILNRAVAKDQNFEDAFWLRAWVRYRSGQAADAVPDAKRALELNDVTLARLKAERAAIDTRAKAELDWKKKQIGGRHLRRESELTVLIDACQASGDFSQARNAAREMIAARPVRGFGYFKLAEVESKTGHRAEAVAALKQAIACANNNLGERSKYEQALRHLS